MAWNQMERVKMGEKMEKVLDFNDNYLHFQWNLPTLPVELFRWEIESQREIKNILTGMTSMTTISTQKVYSKLNGIPVIPVRLVIKDKIRMFK